MPPAGSKGTAAASFNFINDLAMFMGTHASKIDGKGVCLQLQPALMDGRKVYSLLLVLI